MSAGPVTVTEFCKMARTASAENRASGWMTRATAPAVRLEKFRAWLAEMLLNGLVWPRELSAAQAQATACKRWVDGWCVELRREPWLFEPRGLFDHITKSLGNLSYLQAQGMMTTDELATSLAQMERTWRVECRRRGEFAAMRS